jgi:hypothetical protein
MTVTGHTTIYAGWSALCTVSFSENGQTGVTGMPGNQTVLYGQYASSPAEVPVASGKAFAGWYTTSGGTTAFNFNTMAITSHTIIYAKWVTGYTVTFSANGQSGVTGMPDPQTVAPNGYATSPAQTPVAPAAAHKTFTGWNATSEWWPPFDFAGTPITGDTTIYAGWGPEEFTLTFSKNGQIADSWPANQSIPYGESWMYDPDSPSAYRRKLTNTAGDKVVLGWYKEALCTNEFDFGAQVTGNVTAYARWIPNASYTVKYYLPQVTPGMFNTHHPLNRAAIFMYPSWYGEWWNFIFPYQGYYRGFDFNATAMRHDNWHTEQWVPDPDTRRGGHSYSMGGSDWPWDHVPDMHSTGRASLVHIAPKDTKVASASNRYFQLTLLALQRAPRFDVWIPEVVNDDPNGAVRNPNHDLHRNHSDVWRLGSAGGPVYDFDTLITGNINLYLDMPMPLYGIPWRAPVSWETKLPQ